MFRHSQNGARLGLFDISSRMWSSEMVGDRVITGRSTTHELAPQISSGAAGPSSLQKRSPHASSSSAPAARNISPAIACHACFCSGAEKGPDVHEVPSLARGLWLVQVYQPSSSSRLSQDSAAFDGPVVNVGCGPGPVGWSCTHSRSRVLAPTSSPNASLSALASRSAPSHLESCIRLRDPA